jgi:hypothetical protein
MNKNKFIIPLKQQRLLKNYSKKRGGNTEIETYNQIMTTNSILDKRYEPLIIEKNEYIFDQKLYNIIKSQYNSFDFFQEINNEYIIKNLDNILNYLFSYNYDDNESSINDILVNLNFSKNGLYVCDIDVPNNSKRNIFNNIKKNGGVNTAKIIDDILSFGTHFIDINDIDKSYTEINNFFTDINKYTIKKTIYI